MEPGTKTALIERGALENTGAAIWEEGLQNIPEIKNLLYDQRKTVVNLKSEKTANGKAASTYGLRPGESVEEFNKRIKRSKTVKRYD